MDRTIKVKIVNETPRRVTINILSLNRKMPVDRDAFEERVKSGLYEVIE